MEWRNSSDDGPHPLATFFPLYQKGVIDQQQLKKEEIGMILKQNALKMDQMEDILFELCGLKSKRTNSGLNKNELKMWLVNTLSESKVAPDTKCRKYLHFLEANPRSTFGRQLLMFTCISRPRDIASVFLNKPQVFEKFFLENDQRCKNWFLFRFDGKNERGALALEQFIFMHRNRDELWKRLAWTRRTVPPCVAIQKRNLLLELDIPKTLKMVSKWHSTEDANSDDHTHDSTLWESSFFQETLVDGEFLALDYSFFVEHLAGILENRTDPSSAKERKLVLNAVEDYLLDEPFSELCQKLVLLLDDQEILEFVYHLLSPKQEDASRVIVSECKWNSLEQLVLYNAIFNHSRKLIKLVLDEANENWVQFSIPRTLEERIKDEEEHAIILKELRNSSPTVQCRYIGIQSLVVLYRLTILFKTRESLEIIMRNENISFEALTMDDSSKKHKKSKSKKRRHDFDTEQFIGWRFEKNGPVYSVFETPLYLFGKVVSRMLQQVGVVSA